MEKFSRFNDATTGVNPFTQQPYRPTIAQRAVGALLLVAKAPLALLGALLLMLAAALLSCCARGYVSRLVRLGVESPAATLVLWAASVWTVERVTSPIRAR